MARKSFVRQTRGSRRKTLWLANATVTATIGGAGSASLLTTLNAAALALRPFTVIRTRGILSVISDQLVATEFADIAYGEIIVQEPAAAAGAASIPLPVDEDESDWYVYERGMSNFNFLDSTGTQSSAGYVQKFDSKAMRKVDIGQTLIAVAQTAAGSAGAIVSVYSRNLIKLH